MINQSIKKLSILFALVTLIIGCDQSESLQRYFVDNQEKSDFLSIDVPVSMLNLDEDVLTEDQLTAYNSINKLNMLAFTKTNANDSIFAEELAQVKTILDNPKYEELMRGGNSVEGKFLIKYIGEDEAIDELIIFGNMKDKGFIVVRVLGDEMRPSEIMKLQSALDNINPDNTGLRQFTDFFE